MAKQTQKQLAKDEKYELAKQAAKEDGVFSPEYLSYMTKCLRMASSIRRENLVMEIPIGSYEDMEYKLKTI